MKLFYVLTVILFASVPAFAGHGYVHPTERYIPIGSSPGLQTLMGCIKNVNADGSVFVVGTSREDVQVIARPQATADQTWIFIDRSALKLTNEIGTLADLQVGKFVEVDLYDDYPWARWIKIADGGEFAASCQQ